MRRPFHTKQFQKDVKRLQKSGINDMEKLKRVVNMLIDETPLGKPYLDHPLKGYFKDRRECHIGPDWLRVYKLNKDGQTIIFERTGSHADIFG
jgi:mRNA interferase YafQ